MWWHQFALMALTICLIAFYHSTRATLQPISQHSLDNNQVMMIFHKNIVALIMVISFRFRLDKMRERLASNSIYSADRVIWRLSANMSLSRRLVVPCSVAPVQLCHGNFRIELALLAEPNSEGGANPHNNLLQCHECWPSITGLLQL